LTPADQYGSLVADERSGSQSSKYVLGDPIGRIASL
jgi:hypothetical protein